MRLLSILCVAPYSWHLVSKEPFWRRLRKFLLTLPNGNEKCILAKNSKTFSVPTTHWRSNLGLAESFWKFLSSLPTGHGKCVWSLTLENFFPLLLFGDEWCVLTNFLQNFFPTSPCGWGSRFFKEIHIFIWNFCRPRLHGRNVNPHYPLEVKLRLEQRIQKFLFLCL